MTTLNRKAPTHRAWGVALFLLAAVAAPGTAYGWTRTTTAAGPTMLRLQTARFSPLVRVSPVRMLATRTFYRAPIEPPRPPGVDGTERQALGDVSVTLRGSYGTLHGSDVMITGPNGFAVRGTVGTPLTVPAGVGLDVIVTASGLVDRPTRRIDGLVVRPDSNVTNIPLGIETGLIRAQATVDGRRVSGVVRLYRVNVATGMTANRAAGSIGATGTSSEISTGRYRAVLNYGGRTLTRDVQVRAGAATLVRLSG